MTIRLHIANTLAPDLCGRAVAFGYAQRVMQRKAAAIPGGFPAT